MIHNVLWMIHNVLWMTHNVLWMVIRGNGQCLSLREMAALTYNDEKELAGFSYTDPWDAE